METMTVNDQEFYLERMLGKGKAGISWLVHDQQGHPFVLKEMHHESCPYNSHFDNQLYCEVRDYIILSSLDVTLPKLYAVDTGQERLLKEYIPGQTIQELTEQNALKPVYLKQMNEMAKVLYKEGLNIDYDPTNFVINEDGKIYYVDYECNPYRQEWDFEHYGSQYWINEKDRDLS